MSMRVAIASSYGSIVDQYLEKSKKFLIFDISNNQVKLIEERERNSIYCGDTIICGIIKFISDCKIVVSRIGAGYSQLILINGIEVYEESCLVCEIINWLSSSKKFKYRKLSEI